MAYTTQRPSSSTRSLNRTTNTNRDYSSVLSGFSQDLADIRSKLLSDALATIDLQIEVGSASVEQKIELYQNYLASLNPDTAEYQRVQLKIENLYDQVSAEDFAIAKALYAGNQINSEEYYRILKERAAEPNISDKELRQRTVDLWEFEQKIQKQTNENALQDAMMQENLGLITASDRLQVMKQVLANTKDPDQIRTLKSQIINQQKKVYSEELSIRELNVRKAIQEGLATKEDLLPIYQEKIQTAVTAEDALQAEISAQALIKDITEERVAFYEKQSTEIKKATTGALRNLDAKIERAKESGDLTTLGMLYNAKRDMVYDFMQAPNVADEDKISSSSMLTFMKDVFGEDLAVDAIDPATGEFPVYNIAPTANLNILEVEDALLNPDSSLVVRGTAEDGVTPTVEVVHGDKFVITDPNTGESKTMYDFGDKALALLPARYEQIYDEAGNPVLNEGEAVYKTVLPTGTSVQKLPDGYQEALKGANQKPLKSDEFSGEYIELGTDSEGNVKRGYIVYGDKAAKNPTAAQINFKGREDAYIIFTKDNQLPSEATIRSDDELFIPSPFQNAVINVGAAIQEKIIPSGFQKAIDVGKDILGGQFSSGAFGDLSRSLKLQEDIAAGTTSVGAPKVDVPQVDTSFTANLPSFDNLFSRTTKAVGSQILSGVFKASGVDSNVSQSVASALPSSLYKSAAQNIFGKAFQNTAVGQTVSSFKNVFNKVSSFFGGN